MLAAFGPVTPTRALGEDMRTVFADAESMILRERPGGPTIPHMCDNTMIGSPAGSTVHQAARPSYHATQTEQEGTRTLLDRDTGTDATTASG